jgi:hypothetical protein
MIGPAVSGKAECVSEVIAPSRACGSLVESVPTSEYFVSLVDMSSVVFDH